MRPTLQLTLIPAAIQLIAASALHGACPPSDHDCFTVGAPGCTDITCCNTVCAADAFCCNAAWDNACVNLAIELCGAPPCDWTCPPGASPEPEPCGADTNGGCNLPVLGTSDCCRDHGTPGCDDAACEQAVCNVDFFCCTAGWDGFCAFLALEQCPTVCALGPASFTPIACGQTICGTVWAEGGTVDTDWFQFTLGTSTEVTMSASSKRPIVFGIVDTDGVPDCALAGPLSPSAQTQLCGTESFTACLPAGTYWIQVRPVSFSGLPCGSGNNDYWVSLACGGPCVPPACGSPSVGDCFTASGSPFCSDAECCETVCAIDSFCCDVAWDGACVGSAKLSCVTCEIPCPPGAQQEQEACGEDTNGGCNLPILGSSSCCQPGSTPGCDDLGCQTEVCNFEPFCCDVAWDGGCAVFASFFCPDVCTLGQPAFEPISCGTTICGTAWAENNFKDTDWYEFTLSEITVITVTGLADFPLLIGLSDTGGTPGCGPASGAKQLNPLALGNPCTETSFSTCIGPGTWYLFVANQSTSGWPCVEPSCSCPDLTGNGEVDGADLGILLGAWDTSDPCADLNGDGTVDGADLGSLLGAWGEFECPASGGGNSYTVTLTCGGAPCLGPANNFCIDATPIGLGNTSFSTAGATTDGPQLPIDCEEGLGLVMVRDVWFKHTAGFNGILKVSTCGQASFDTRLAGYSGSCGALVLEGCNDDSPGCFLNTSEMFLFVEQGTTYFIRVGSFGDEGGGTLTLSQF